MRLAWSFAALRQKGAEKFCKRNLIVSVGRAPPRSLPAWAGPSLRRSQPQWAQCRYPRHPTSIHAELHKYRSIKLSTVFSVVPVTNTAAMSFDHDELRDEWVATLNL